MRGAQGHAIRIHTDVAAAITHIYNSINNLYSPEIRNSKADTLSHHHWKLVRSQRTRLKLRLGVAVKDFDLLCWKKEANPGYYYYYDGWVMEVVSRDY